MAVRGKIRKWGNSLGLRIRKSIADQVDIRENTDVSITVSGSTILITPEPPSYKLSELLDDIIPDSIHGEVDLGFSEGREVW